MDLTKRAIGVKLSISSFGNRRKDKRLAGAIAEKYGADPRAFKGHKTLVDPEYLERIEKLAGYARNRVHYRLSLPWADGGLRILPIGLYEQYLQEMSEYKNEWESEVEKFLTVWPDLREQAQSWLNGLFREEEYPRDISNHFDFRVSFRPLPNASDFRVELGDDAVKAIREDIEEEMETSVMLANQELGQRLFKKVAHMAERLDAYGEDAEGKVIGDFKSSLVGNIRDLVRLAPAFNLGQDARIDELISDIDQHLTPYEADDLKADEDLRKRVAQKAKEAQSSIEDYFGI
jgi:hypothetical protein